MPERPILHVNPGNDPVFRSFAERLVERGAGSVPNFQAHLRVGYPSAVVHVRLLDAERRRVWYVYRDGRWVTSRGPEPVNSG